MRCIKPNSNQCSGVFDENLILSQLISSGSIAYQKLMKTGFPAHMSILDLFSIFKSKQGFNEHTSTNQKEFCSRLLRACHLKRNDFVIGNTKIFFRNGKYEMLIEQLKIDPNKILLRLNKLKLLRSKWNVVMIIARFIGRASRTGVEMEMEIGSPTKFPDEDHFIKDGNKFRKKMRLDTEYECIPPSKQIIGN